MFEDEFTYTAPEPLVIEFAPPLVVNAAGKEHKLERLELPEPMSGQVWVAEQHLVAKNGSRANRMYQRALVAKVGKVPELVIDGMPMSAFSKAIAHLQAFVDAGFPETEGDLAETMPPSMTIRFDDPIGPGSAAVNSMTLTELTLGQMAKADSALGDMSRQKLRQWQEAVVGESAKLPATVIAELPVSVLNRAASFVSGFSNAGQTIST